MDVEGELAAVANAAPEGRGALLERLIRRCEAMTEAEESVLFPALRLAMGDEPLLAESCVAEHRDIHDRLQALARRPRGAGFDRALAGLAQDMRNHQHDEMDTVLPVLTEALGEEGSAALAEAFAEALAAARR